MATVNTKHSYYASLPIFDSCFSSIGSELFFFQIITASIAEMHPIDPTTAQMAATVPFDSETVIYRLNHRFI